MKNRKSVFRYMATKTYNENGEVNLLKKVFEDKTLRFTTPNDFNDPFEVRHIIEYLNPSVSPDLNTLINTTFDTHQFHNIALDSELKHVGTLCLSAENDDILMWSHYANKHKGIVLEFDKDHPFFVTKPLAVEGLLHGIERVNYQPDRLFYKNIDKHFSTKYTFLTKDKKWEHEQEYRMTVRFDESNNDNKYNISFPAELIKAVYIGVKTNKEDIEYILNLPQKKEWEHLSIYKFEMDSEKYKLKPFKAIFK